MQNSVVEEIKSRLNIVDVIGEYIKMEKAGANWKALCPFHNEKGPSFMVNEERQMFHCFGCHKSGDVLSFVMEIESLDFKEALKVLAEKAGVPLTQFNPQAGKEKDKSVEILELATKFYETQLWKGMGKEKIIAYLKDRGLSEDSIRNFRLGYAPNGWDNVIKFLTGRGYTLLDIEKTGLLVKKENGSGYYDRFRDRIMFPVCDPMGKVIGYSARVAPGGDESQAKYINTPESNVYHKSKALYGIHLAKNAIKQKNFVLLVEGNMDVVAAHQAGFSNTVAVSGTALTGDQLDILKRYTENIKMLFDMDSAGQQAAQRSADLCFQKGLNVHVVALKEGKDAADAVQKDPQQLIDAITQSVPAMEYFFTEIAKRFDKSQPEGKKSIAQNLLERINNISNHIEKSHWMKKLAQELEVEEKVIFDVLKSAAQGAHRFEQREEVAEETPFKRRFDLIREKIGGIVMCDPAVWAEITAQHQEGSPLRSDRLLNYILEKGPECGFLFENILLKTENEASRKKLQDIYFDARYHFDNAQNIVEYSKDEIRMLAMQYIGEFVKELQKQRRDAIIKEIKLAEQSGDKEKLNTLMREFTELSQALK